MENQYKNQAWKKKVPVQNLTFFSIEPHKNNVVALMSSAIFKTKIT